MGVRSAPARARPPLVFHLTGGEAADRQVYETLIDLPTRAPEALFADQGHDSDAFRADLEAGGIPIVTPRAPTADRSSAEAGACAGIATASRAIGHPTIAARYHKLAESFLGMLYLAAARLWLEFVCMA